MAYAVFRTTEAGTVAASRSFGKRAAAESIRHAILQHHPDWQLSVQSTDRVQAAPKGPIREAKRSA